MCQTCSAALAPTRRSLLLGGFAALVASTIPAFALEGSVPPDLALQQLVEGNARHVAGQRANTDFISGRAARALSQRPLAAILSCSDSRVPPELVFDQGPGDLFVVRVAGNFVNEDGLASLEYAINYLGTQLIMVLGHSNCGAVDAAIKVFRDKAVLPGHLAEMVNPILPAAEAALSIAPEDPVGLAIETNVTNAVEALKSAAPILAPRVANGGLKIVGAQYDLATGKVALI
jgi:carbonic anhydrase